MTFPTPITLILASLGACTAVAKSPLAEGEATVCALEERAGTYVATLTAAEAMSGSYDFVLSGGGVSLDQGGPFVAAPGETVILGEASVGRRLPVERLTLHVGGREIACPLVRR